MKFYKRAAALFLTALLTASAAMPVFASETEEPASSSESVVETLVDEETADNSEESDGETDTEASSQETEEEDTAEAVSGVTTSVQTESTKEEEDSDEESSESEEEASESKEDQTTEIPADAVSAIADQVYTGSAIEPEITVTVDETELAEDTDYTVSFENNTEAGTASATVTGCGSYTGSVTVTFEITKAENSISASNVKLTASETAKQKLALEASAEFGTISYESDQSKVTVNASGTVTVAKGFCGAATLTLTVAGTENYEGVETTILVRVIPEAVDIDRILFVSSGKIRMTWMLNSLATGYQIQYAEESDFSDSKTVKITSNTTLVRTISGLTDGKLYYVRIRAYTSNGAVNVYSPWTKAKVTIKVSSGIDVSLWNGTINWTKVAASGVDFAMIRAGYGNDASQEDTMYDTNVAGAQAAGLATGAYWFSYATSVADAKKEADVCYSIIKNSGLTLPVFFDFEYDSVAYAKKQGVSVTGAMAAEFALAFMDRMISYGVESGLYSNLDYLNSYFYSNSTYVEKLSDYPLWYAEWDTSDPTYTGEYWQYASDGSVSGITGNVDMNQSNLLYSSTARYYVRKITLNKSTASVRRTKTLQLTASIYPVTAYNQNVTWTSSDSSIAKVSSAGKVTGKAEGTAVITATTEDGGYTASCSVTVKPKATAVSLNTTSKNIYVGRSFTITPTIDWGDDVEQTYSWTSSNKKVAKVSSSGKVTGVAKGTAVITLTTSDGKTATCKVTVKVPASSVKLSLTKKSLTPGKTVQLKATVYPTTANNRTVTWTSSNTSVAKVSSAGKVTAKGKGSCVITAATHNGKTAKCKITVTETLVKYKTTDALNYRTGPGTSYTSKGVLAKGSKVYVVKGYSKTANGYKWYMIKRSGKYYYVAAKYLKKV